MLSRNIYILVGLCLIALFVYCGTASESEQTSNEYLNWDDSVTYVGDEACASCHQENYQSFKRTGMGESFHFATKNKSKADFGNHIVVYDSLNNLHYHPFWKGDSMKILEYRVLQNDTVHKKEIDVKYIVGSGQHTNSHIVEENGYLTQAPITFYTQKGIWDIAPGFDSKLANRLNRIVGKECMTCHNSYPKMFEGSENKFETVPLGIGCERCHGPGSEHIKRKLAGEVIDTSKYIDYSIVNPGKLSKELQMSVCQRCHAQGVAILKDGIDFEDFKPGKHLSEVMEVYLPKFDGNQTQFIMASHADRTAMSKCYKMSEMTCISCHNPHVSVKETPRVKFNKACQNCHGVEPKQLLCSENLATRQQKEDDCSGCHMPVSSSIDIPHVTVHDHFIRKPIDADEKGAIENFIGLKNITNPEGKSDLDFGRAYLKYYEAFQSENRMLDSAAYYLNKVNDFDEKAEDLVHLYYLKSDFNQLTKLSKKIPIASIKKDWTFYRIGEAFYSLGKFREAEKYFTKAVELLPLSQDFQNKLGSVYMQQNKMDKAEKIFAEIVKENKTHIPALNNLGFILFNKKNTAKANEYYEQALSLNPDYIPALLNKVGLHYFKGEKAIAKKYLDRVIAIEPGNEKVRFILEQGWLE